MKMHRYILFILSTLICVTHTCGQQVPDFIFKHLTVNEGLVSNNVICTLQDSKGFWWIGTDNGLQRWDGYRFNTYNYNPDNKSSLHSDKVLKLMEDSRKNIWIGHLDGVTIYSVTKNLFTRVPIDTSEKAAPFSESLNTLFEDKWHNVWIAGNGIGLQWYNDSLAGLYPILQSFRFILCDFNLQHSNLLRGITGLEQIQG
jgi:ligand-binding sensor domain-containing protein